MKRKKINNLDTDEVLDQIRISLIKVVYSDINNYNIKDFDLISPMMAINILKQLKEFRLDKRYDYPKFILYSNSEQIKEFYQLLMNGKTLTEIENFYISDVRKEQAKIKLKTR